MLYVAYLEGWNAAGEFVKFNRDVDYPRGTEFLVRRNLPLILQREEGYKDVRVLAVREREVVYAVGR